MIGKNALALTRDDEVNIPVYPAFSNTPAIIQSRNPLNTIAENSPKVFANVAKQMLDNQLAIQRNETMEAISSHNRDIACTWLNRRNPGETRIKIGTAGGAKKRGWFGSGEEIALTTAVEIG